jgi:hypothetical protein
MDVMVGANHSMNENTDGKYAKTAGLKRIGDAIGVGASIGIGKEWSNLWGWHFGLGYNSNKGRATFYTKQRELYTFFDVEAFGDLTMDLTDWLAPHRTKDNFNLKAMLGVGVLRTFSFDKEQLAYYDNYSTSPKFCLGARAGLQARYRVTNEMALAMNMFLYGMEDKFSGVDVGFPVDGRLNLNIGMIWNLHLGGKKVKVSTGTVPLDVTPKAVEYEITPIMAYVEPERETKLCEYKGSAYVDYPVNDTKLYPTFRDNPVELRKVRTTIDQVMMDSLSTIQCITIHGYASPEGKYENNQRLSKERTLTMRKYIADTFALSDSIIAYQSTAEDWQGLRKYIEDSSIDSKDIFLKLIDEDLDPDLKLQKMQDISPSDYNYLLEGIFPRLRRCDYTISYIVRNLTLSETHRLLKTRPESLSLREFYDLAVDEGIETEAFNQVMLLAAKTYPNNEIANLNAACVLIKQGKIDESKSYLEKAGKLPETIHAQGIVAMLEKNYEIGLNLLKSSAHLGVKESRQVLDDMKLVY